MSPIEIPQDWDDRGLITFEEFCDLIRTPRNARCATGANVALVRVGHGSTAAGLYITVAEARGFLASATPTRLEERVDG